MLNVKTQSWKKFKNNKKKKNSAEKKQEKAIYAVEKIAPLKSHKYIIACTSAQNVFNKPLYHPSSHP